MQGAKSVRINRKDRKMSDIQMLVSEFEDMCGESETEIGKAALLEMRQLREAISGLLLLVEAHTSENTQHHYLGLIDFARCVLKNKK